MSVKIKKSLVVLSIALISILAINLASAESWECMTKGEKVKYCGNYHAPFTCKDNVCAKCMSEYRESSDCYVGGAWGRCNALGTGCSATDGNGTSGNVDGIAPQFSLSSPTSSELFNSRKALVEFSLDEQADVYYLDLINGRGRWSKVCTHCAPGSPAFSKNISFKEGENQIVFKAVDEAGNEANQSATFFIDSKKPKISKTFPKKGFANGKFEVTFAEENPKTLILHYGSNTKELNINDCVKDKGDYSCNTTVDLSSYNGQDIVYWFSLEDIVGNIAESKQLTLSVDISAPIVTNPDSFFSVINGTKYVQFALNITEPNFAEVTYSYIDSKGKLKEKVLCTSLKNGECNKKVSFLKGSYDLTVNVADDAGNKIGLPASFTIDY